MKRITIGRSSMNDVNINDPYVSRKHCQIIQNDDGDYILIDKSSANGTFVNGVKIQGEVNLNPNDIVRIGNTILPWSTYFMDNNIGEKKRAFMYKRVIVFFLVVSVCVIGVRSCSKEKELGNIKNENEELHAKNKALNDSIDVLNDSIGDLNNKIGVLSNANEATFKVNAPDGAFLVNRNGKCVYFSSGNLQYTQSTNTWSFASTQWEMIGTDNVTGGSVTSSWQWGDKKEGIALADKIDLFGWSTSSTNFGVSTSTDHNDYLGSFVDWGTNKIGNYAPNTWRTLTYDEWSYVVFHRPNASSLKGVAQVHGVNGLILLPDNWTCPSGVSFKSGFHSERGVDYYAAYQTFTAAEWSKLEAAGAVFLPASGCGGSDVDFVQGSGWYWSATEDYGYCAYFLDFASDGASVSHIARSNGFSVRLVKDL